MDLDLDLDQGEQQADINGIEEYKHLRNYVIQVPLLYLIINVEGPFLLQFKALRNKPLCDKLQKRL